LEKIFKYRIHRNNMELNPEIYLIIRRQVLETVKDNLNSEIEKTEKLLQKAIDRRKNA
jgi:hypothetical protein